MSGAPVLPPAEESPTESLTLKVSQSTVRRLDAIAKRSGHKRHRVLVHFIEWAMDAWEKDNPEGER